MKITQNQIQQIHSFIKSKGVVWYDVRLELVDHFANALEDRFNDDNHLDFTTELNLVYKNFEDLKFKKLIKDKSKIVNKKLWFLAFNHFKTFFKLPKIIFSVLLFLVLNKLMLYIENKEAFFNVLHVLLMILSVLSLIKGISYVHYKYQLLMLSTTSQLFLLINSFAVIFSSMNTFTKHIQIIEFYQFKLLIFVLFIILIATTFYVYNKIRKDVQVQYSEIKII